MSKQLETKHTLQKNPWVKEEVSREIKTCIDLNENGKQKQKQNSKTYETTLKQ